MRKAKARMYEEERKKRECKAGHVGDVAMGFSVGLVRIRVDLTSWV